MKEILVGGDDYPCSSPVILEKILVGGFVNILNIPLYTIATLSLLMGILVVSLAVIAHSRGRPHQIFLRQELENEKGKTSGPAGTYVRR